MSAKPRQNKFFLSCAMTIALVSAFFVTGAEVSQIETSRAPASALLCRSLFLENGHIDDPMTFGRLPDRNLQPRELADLAARVAHQHESEIIRTLQKTKPNEEGRVFYKIHEDQHITVWAIEWDNNGTEIHDHVNSQAGIHVLRGEALEERFLPPSPIPLKRILKEGQSVGLSGLPYVHRISGNKSITIHIYSPPLKEMTKYQLNRVN